MKRSKSKSSRKGKKAWRANISTEETEQYFIEQGADERAGGSLDQVPSDALFVVDRSKDYSIEKKTRKNRDKVLRCDSILQRNSLVPPLRAPLKRKTKRKDRDVAKPLVKRKPLPATEEIAGDMECSLDIWESQESTGQSTAKNVAAARVPPVDAPALEVDAPGCSYNPTFDDHQEALGLAVAEEMQKLYKRELEPAPIPKLVPGLAVDEEDLYFLEADVGGEGVDEDDPDHDDVHAIGSRAVKANKLTRAELNKKARRRQSLRVELAKTKLSKLKKDFLRIPEILEDLATEQSEKERYRVRRNISREEKSAQRPPRLGKHKFKPEPVQVLLTEEVTGSLRNVKACYTLVRDRFKSLQRRGLLEPRVRVSRTKAKKRVMYEPGTKGQQEREMHASRQAEKEASKHALAIIPLQ